METAREKYHNEQDMIQGQIKKSLGHKFVNVEYFVALPDAPIVKGSSGFFHFIQKLPIEVLNYPLNKREEYSKSLIPHKYGKRITFITAKILSYE